QAAAVVLHLFDELERRKIARQDPCRGPRRDGGERGALLRLEAHRPQARQETAVDFIGLRLQEVRQPLQMKTQLIAQYIRGVGELGRNLCSLHEDKSAD